MRRIPLQFLLAASLVASGHAQKQVSAPAQQIDFDGNILTGVGLTGPHPQRVTALAIRDGIVLATGSDAQIVRAWKGAATRMVDLHGVGKTSP